MNALMDWLCSWLVCDRQEVLPPPCSTLNREPYSAQYSYIYRLSRQV